MEAEQVPLEVPLEVPFEPSEPAPKGPSTSCQGGGELTERVCVWRPAGLTPRYKNGARGKGQRTAEGETREERRGEFSEEGERGTWRLDICFSSPFLYFPIFSAVIAAVTPEGRIMKGMRAETKGGWKYHVFGGKKTEKIEENKPVFRCLPDGCSYQCSKCSQVLITAICKRVAWPLFSMWHVASENQK